LGARGEIHNVFVAGQVREDYCSSGAT